MVIVILENYSLYYIYIRLSTDKLILPIDVIYNPRC